MGILDTIKDTKQSEVLRRFEPVLVVTKILEGLKSRDREILTKRYGLHGGPAETLETIGKTHNLTRERVRQIEKSLIKSLRTQVSEGSDFKETSDLLVSAIKEHGNILAEDRLLHHLGIENEQDKNAVRFILALVSELEELTGDPLIKSSWTSVGFSKSALSSFVTEVKRLLDLHGKPFTEENFLELFKETEFFKKNAIDLADQILVNYIHTAQHIRKNSFQEFGLSHWNEIHPKDVGDKAYLVLKHHEKPEHYSKITELINARKFDARTAYKETVHNELIKDPRFVLVGRGIYALTEWGFKSGVVSDVIREVIKANNGPMEREKIIEEVLKRRFVKRNTVLVGLSNKKHFKKVGKNLYDVVK